MRKSTRTSRLDADFFFFLCFFLFLMLFCCVENLNIEAHEAVRQDWPYIGRTGIEKVVNYGKKVTGATRKARYGAHRSIIVANFSCESVGTRFGIKIENFPLSKK